MACLESAERQALSEGGEAENRRVWAKRPGERPKPERSETPSEGETREGETSERVLSASEAGGNAPAPSTPRPPLALSSQLPDFSAHPLSRFSHVSHAAYSLPRPSRFLAMRRSFAQRFIRRLLTPDEPSPAAWRAAPLPEPGSLSLPQATHWSSPEEVAAYALVCIAALELEGWSFAWDRAVRRLGCCSPAQKRVSLSRYFVAHYLERDVELIRRTLLHELAHALCWEKAHRRGHGAAWRACCAALGIPGEKATVRCESFVPEHLRRPRYALCLADSGEVVRYYRRCPTKLTPAYLKKCYIPGRRKETMGRLRLIALPEDAPLPPAPGLEP